jgi:hypothetical protein
MEFGYNKKKTKHFTGASLQEKTSIHLNEEKCEFFLSASLPLEYAASRALTPF